MTWPMCGAPTGDECSTCAETGRTCYHDVATVTVEEMTPEAGMEMFDRRCRSELDISGPDFLQRYDAGEYNAAIYEDCCHPAARLAILIPFARAVADT